MPDKSRHYYLFSIGEKTKPSFGGKFGQNYEQTLLLFSSQPPPLFALSLQLDAVKKRI